MASNLRCFFLLLALSLAFCLETHARDSKFFSKVSKENKESISIAPIQSPTQTPSPSPEPDVVEHGYGLYGQETTYQYPPTTTNPTKSDNFGQEKFVSSEDLSKNNFKEFGMGYSNDNFNENGNEKKGMRDTRFLENGKYYYDVNQDVKEESSLLNENKNEYVTERQGMSDTRFLENGKYFHDISQEGRNAHFITNNYESENENENENENQHEEFEEKYGHFNNNNFENENHNENEKFNAEKQGMSDTRFLENGKYFYDAKNDHGVGDDVGFHNNNNVEFANTFSRNGNEYENGNYEYETQGREGNNYYHGNEYNVKEGRRGYKPKKFPNEYDTMEEYDREQGYINGHEGEYVP